MISDLVWIILGKLPLRERIKIMRFNCEMRRRYECYPRLMKSYYALSSIVCEIDMDEVGGFLGWQIRNINTYCYNESSLVLLRKCLGIRSGVDRIDLIVGKYLHFSEIRESNFTVRSFSVMEVITPTFLDTRDLRTMMIIAEHVGDIDFIAACLRAESDLGSVLRRKDIMIPTLVKSVGICYEPTIYVHIVDAGLFEEAKTILDIMKLKFVMTPVIPQRRHDWFIKYLINKALKDQVYFDILMHNYYFRLRDDDFEWKLMDEIVGKYKGDTKLDALVKCKSEDYFNTNVWEWFRPFGMK